jgi:2,4-dienoyl-CoA reductase [(3E)-enoyl-CoA-producing], peroxisomal
MSVFTKDCLKGRVAFITGGGSGICKGIARAFLEHGGKVFITSRSEERLSAAAAELRDQTGGEVDFSACDVREGEQVERAMGTCLETLGGLDIVVNGAAGNFLSPAAGLSYNGFKTVMAIDTLGTYNVSKAAFMAGLRETGGVILNISATLHYTGVPLQVHAGCAKAANDAMTRHLAVEWGPAGIRVNGIAPGPVAGTEGVRRLVGAGFKEKIEAEVPLGRFAQISEICDAALFLASDAARFITGEVLVVDGGAWMTAGSLSKA